MIIMDGITVYLACAKYYLAHMVYIYTYKIYVDVHVCYPTAFVFLRKREIEGKKIMVYNICNNKTSLIDT